MLDLGAREAAEIAERFPKVQRRVGGYNLDALVPRNAPNNMAHLLVGSEGTLAFTTQVELKLWPVIRNKVLGVCHFGSFYEAMDAAQHLVKLRPIAVELVDRTMLALGREIAMFQPIIGTAVRGDPDAVLIVEFAEEDQAENIRRLKQLGELMADLGFGWDQPQRKWGGVVEITEPALQTGIAEFRAAGLNVMMSMKQEGKPVSFVEDCAVPLPHLADYTERLNEIFARHGTRGTMYAHASEGCLHVRPVLNLKLEKDVKAMRAIAEETFAMVGNTRARIPASMATAWCARNFTRRCSARASSPISARSSSASIPATLLNPGKIVDAPKMDDRTLFRYPPDYRVTELKTALDWSAYPGAGGGFQGAVEMCNNNGACRKLEGGVMCPSYRATRNEKDVTRGRANTLRLAISGQLGPDALVIRRDDGHAETLRVLQGLPPRMPDRRRHGQDEDRGAGGAGGQARAFAARPAGGLSPALCGAGLALRPARQSSQPQPAVAKAVREIRRHQRAARAAGMAARCVQLGCRSDRPGRWPRSRAVRRHLQSRL